MNEFSCFFDGEDAEFYKQNSIIFHPEKINEFMTDDKFESVKIFNNVT